MNILLSKGRQSHKGKIFFGVYIIILVILREQSRLPLWSDYRPMIQGLFLLLSLSIITLCVQLYKSNKNTVRLIALIVIINCTLFIFQEISFLRVKYSILHNHDYELEEIGKHLIIGYQDYNELKLLVQKNAIAGIYITRRNLASSKVQLQDQIQELQTIRSKKNLPKIWITADQEGGDVSHLSPPLTQQTSLSKVVENLKDKVKIQNLTKNYASVQGKDLSQLGVNLNLSPVVDIRSVQKNNTNVSISEIYERSISHDEKIVTEVALSYCETLYRHKVRCTAKHFPGLGRVEQDTHFSDAKLDTSIAELERKDWIPFKTLMRQTNAFVMLGHVILTEIDQNYPVSISRKVIYELIREKWNYEGILITDDFGMHPIYQSKIGAGEAAIKALNNGVDLLLVSSDPDLYYPVMFTLLQAYKSGRLDAQQLKLSQERLERFQL